jgi:hypothetical protein
MLLKLTKFGVATLLAFLAFTSTTTRPSLLRTAEAAGCTHAATRWIYDGCCSAPLTTRYRLQWCNHGTWTNTTTTDCRGTCIK